MHCFRGFKRTRHILNKPYVNSTRKMFIAILPFYNFISVIPCLCVGVVLNSKNL